MKPSWGRNRSLFYRGWGHSRFLVCGRSLGWKLNLFEAVPCSFLQDFCAMWCIHTADLWMRAHAWDWERTAVLRELFNIRFSYKNCNFSHFAYSSTWRRKPRQRLFNLVFFTADQSAWLVLNQPTQRGFWRNLRFILYSMVKESMFLRGNFCVYESSWPISTFWHQRGRKTTKCTFEIDFSQNRCRIERKARFSSVC